MLYLMIIFSLVSFLATFSFAPFWRTRAIEQGLFGKDMHKLSKYPVAEAGGVTVIFGLSFGLLAAIGASTFLTEFNRDIYILFVVYSGILISSFVGFIDDVLGWKKGLSNKSRLFTIFFSSVPLMVANAGESNFLGIDFGIIYPLLFIPIGVIGATTVFNFLAGYNGLESSQGIIILLGLFVTFYQADQLWLAIIVVSLAGALIAFLSFNWYPASIFPGDSLTYLVGFTIAVTVIVGRIEHIGLIFFIPYMVEAILKIRGKLKRESFAKLSESGNLEIPYRRFFSLTHIAVYLLNKYTGQAREFEVVLIINFVQLCFVLLGLLLFVL
jgi:UDP-N-acetylglucosamine--dolichyl-phosphate N-acetylglucosaminephosphotransferase